MTGTPNQQRVGASAPGTTAPDDTNLAVTKDGFLDRRLCIRQPRDGYRAAIDPVFLAAAVPARSSTRVLDIGTGVGVAALALAHRVDGLDVTGIEVDSALLRLCRENAKANGLERHTDFMFGDVARPPARLVPGSFDHVMANPPYLEVARADISPVPRKAASNVEGRAGVGGNDADLASWMRLALSMVCEGGTVTVIHRADRLVDVTACLKGRVGGTVIFPLWPNRGIAPAKRVLIQGIKGSGAALRMARGLVLHDDDGRFTQEADAVLRVGEGLIL